MSNIYPITSDKQNYSNKQKYKECSVWLAKIDRELTSQEEKQLEAWLAADEQHQQILFKMAKLWDKMSQLKRLAKLFPVEEKRAQPLAGWRTSIAASVVLAISVGLWGIGYGTNLFSDKEHLVYSFSHNTSVGENRVVYLPDNTKLTLNTDSLLEVRYFDSYRLLELKRGEVHVEVAHDKSRPLSVVAGNKIIQAVGTAFNVQRNNLNVELIVTDGKVIIGKIDPLQPIVHDDLDIPEGAMSVSKGEMASLGQIQNKLQKIDSRSLSANLSWQQGNLIFNGETLEQALIEVGRYTSVKFSIENDALKTIKIAGRFKTGDVNGLIKALNSNFNIKIDRITEKLVVISQK